MPCVFLIVSIIFISISLTVSNLVFLFILIFSLLPVSSNILILLILHTSFALSIPLIPSTVLDFSVFFIT
ncbi:hypothetical protein F5882DRAFT_414702 [Hyaloscypha sp. PMI_1271]|nr:hypothetical protein F5882DRAFT_414702 [Hyaloscypha sp. PMI_1271]